MPFVPGAHKTITHQYTPRLIAIEHRPHDADTCPQNLIIWIHGLGDGLLTVSYPTTLAKALPVSWSLAQVLLKSSYGGWGTSSLKSDANNLAECVKYFRGIRSGKIVLMGHSTGCQDIMEYLVGPGHETRPAVDGGILQAPVSDRELMVLLMSREHYNKSVSTAQAMVSDGKAEEIMPTSETLGFFGAPVCARRWLSLLSPNHDGDDDYFSSDLSDDQLKSTFGALPARTPICILVSGEDEWVPTGIDKLALVTKWMGLVKGRGMVDDKHSGVIEGASHSLQKDPEAVRLDMVKRVLGFLNSLPLPPSL